MIKGKVNRSFLEVLVVAWLTILFDIWAVHLDNLGVQQVFTKYVAHMGYLVLHSLEMPFYITYLVAMTEYLAFVQGERLLAFCHRSRCL